MRLRVRRSPSFATPSANEAKTSGIPPINSRYRKTWPTGSVQYCASHSTCACTAGWAVVRRCALMPRIAPIMSPIIILLCSAKPCVSVGASSPRSSGGRTASSSQFISASLRKRPLLRLRPRQQQGHLCSSSVPATDVQPGAPASFWCAVLLSHFQTCQHHRHCGTKTGQKWAKVCCQDLCEDGDDGTSPEYLSNSAALGRNEWDGGRLQRQPQARPSYSGTAFEWEDQACPVCNGQSDCRVSGATAARHPAHWSTRGSAVSRPERCPGRRGALAGD